MNIFFLSPDPVEAAKAHCDCHVVKMTLETTQLLCSVHHRLGSTFEGIYKPTHLAHPCTLWAAAGLGNYKWLAGLLMALHAEYTRRYHKVHKGFALAQRLARFPPVPLLLRPTYEFRVPPFVGPDECLHKWPELDIVKSYRALYNQKATTMKREMRWTARQPPVWFHGGGTELPSSKATT